MARLFASASAMVWPVTNCSPIMRMARSVPLRIKGSPPRPMRRVRAWPSEASLVVVVSRPVTTRPQVAALTKSDGLRPTWARQSPPAILSRMSASRVARSGMRSSASARHISATPSWLDSAYSRTSPSTPPRRGLLRSRSTRPRATAVASAAAAGERVAPSSSAATQSGSGRRQAAVMAARSGVCRRTDGAKAAKGEAETWTVMGARAKPDRGTRAGAGFPPSIRQPIIGSAVLPSPE